MKESNILHCDLNNFFASVASLKDENLKNVPMAVCGDPKTRSGIILAKNNLAKKYGVVTAETIYSAKKKCPDLVLVSSDYPEYKKYSELVNKVYLKYTNRVEPMSIDESFLDVSESLALYGSSVNIANLIKEDVKNTLGLTISIGISFTKSFAKMGSDMKKPDAITVIDFKNYKRILYPLDINNLLYVGKATTIFLNKKGITKIGDIAHMDKFKLLKLLGKNGDSLYNMVHGLDSSNVKLYTDEYLVKSVSHGRTFKEDSNDLEYQLKRIRDLTNIVATELREKKAKCTVISITIKDNNFISFTRQKKILKTNLYTDMIIKVEELLKENYIKSRNVRMLTVSANNLVYENDEVQVNMFEDLPNMNQNDLLKMDNKYANNNRDNNIKNHNINTQDIKNKVRIKQEKVSSIIDDLNKKYDVNLVKYGSVISSESSKNKTKNNIKTN